MYRIIDDDRERVGQWVSAKNGGKWLDDGIAGIGLERNGVLIAGAVYDSYLEQSVCIHTAIERMNRDFLWYCFYYPFIELKVKKLLGLVDSFNSRAINLDFHLGFQLECSIKDASTQGDLLIFSMTRDQCRWLNVAKRPGVHHGKQRRQCA